MIAALRIGVAKEIKTDEYRVALTPAGALELVQRGHDVIVETGAGDGSSFADAAYEAVGARIASVDDVWAEAELLLKVKEPIAAGVRPPARRARPLHVPAHRGRRAADAGARRQRRHRRRLRDGRDRLGALPLLAPMSEIAGRLAAQAGAYFLEKPLGGRGPAARRRARRRAGPRRRDRRRHRRLQRGGHRARPRRAR